MSSIMRDVIHEAVGNEWRARIAAHLYDSPEGHIAGITDAVEKSVMKVLRKHLIYEAEEPSMAETPEKITLVVEQITSREMEKRIAEAKADALLEFADSIPEPWGSLHFFSQGSTPRGTTQTLRSLLEERADEIIRAADR